MITKLYFKQKKPTTIIILGIVLIVLAGITIYQDVGKFEQTGTMLGIGVSLLGYSVSYEFKEDYKHKKHFKIFRITILRSKLECFVPEYVTVFSSVGVKNSEWGPVAAIGGKTEEDSYVVRMFKGNMHFTLGRTESYSSAKRKAVDFGRLLKIEVRLKD